MQTQLDGHKIESAIEFLFIQLKDVKSSKPVGLHSVRVASLLWDEYTNNNLIIAAVLHDVVEDTNIKISKIKELFGTRVAEIVNACTFDNHSSNYSQKSTKAKRSIDKAALLGKDALLVKAADFIDNADYYERVEDDDLKEYLILKYKYFIKVASIYLCDEPIWQHVLSTYENKVKDL